MAPALAITLLTKNPALGMATFFPPQVQEAYEDVKNDKSINLTETQKQVYAL